MLTPSEIEYFLALDKGDRLKARAREGQRYYEADHDIRNYRIFVPDADGHYVEDRNKSNVKISHPFFTELVDQAVQYMLSGKDGFVFSDDPEIQNLLDRSFNQNDGFMAEMYDLLTAVQVNGFAYIYAYEDEDGGIAFQSADGIEVIEVRAKDTQDSCDHVICYYVDRLDDDGDPIIKIQVWSEDEVWYYVKEGANLLVLDEGKPLNPRPITLQVSGGNELQAGSLGVIPFFRIDYNKKRTSALKPIKALIDDYDLMNCGLSNNLADFAEAIFVVRNYQGEDIDELVSKVRVRKAVGVDSDGGLDIKTIDIPYQARQTKLKLDEDNIYRFGMGFNSQQVGDGNITNVVIKSRYALLDLKCNKLETRLRQLLHRLVGLVLDHEGIAWDNGTFRFSFTREMITNALDNAQVEQVEAQTRNVEINTLLSLAERLDSETLMKGVCEVLDIDYEEIRDRLPNPELEGYEDMIADDGDTEGTGEADGGTAEEGAQQAQESL